MKPQTRLEDYHHGLLAAILGLDGNMLGWTREKKRGSSDATKNKVDGLTGLKRLG